MENFKPQNIEPKKDDPVKQGKSFARGLRNVVVAGLATLAMAPNKGEAQVSNLKEPVSKVYTDSGDAGKNYLIKKNEGKEFFKYYDNKEEYEKAKQVYQDSLNLYLNGEKNYNDLISTGKNRWGQTVNIQSERRFYNLQEVIDDGAMELHNKNGFNLQESKVIARRMAEQNLEKNFISGDFYLPFFVCKFSSENLQDYIFRFKKPLEIPKLREHKSLGSINVHGKSIDYYSEEQKNRILETLKAKGINPTQVGSTSNYTISRFEEKTGGWQGDTLIDKNGSPILSL